MLLTYDSSTFQILGQKLSKIFVGILVQTMTPKGHFEINWPLADNIKIISFVCRLRVISKNFKEYYVLQVILCQMHSFMHQLAHNMTSLFFFTNFGWIFVTYLWPIFIVSPQSVNSIIFSIVFTRTSLEMDGTLDFDCFHLGANFWP